MKTIKVLIAENNIPYLRSLCRMLGEEEDIEVLGLARNGREAIQKSEALQPDVVLMDIDMPQKSGLLATQTIRKRWPEIQVIILTLHNGEAFQNWAKEMGALFLPKDTDPDKLIKAIRTAKGQK